MHRRCQARIHFRSSTAAFDGNAAQKVSEIVGDVIDVRRVAAGELPFLAKDLARAGGHHQHGGHAERVRHFEIAGEVLEDRGLARIDAVTGEETVIDLRPRLWLEFGRRDIENILEVLLDLKPPHHRFGVPARAVGEHELAARELGDRRAERGVGRQRRVIDLMNDFEEFVRVEAVLLHEPAQRRAVAPVIILLHPERFLVRDLEEAGDVVTDALVDLLPEI